MIEEIRQAKALEHINKVTAERFQSVTVNDDLATDMYFFREDALLDFELSDKAYFEPELFKDEVKK